ncbi:hypothetical protein JST97_25980 [bacterium]|nr:hypothetical protein [bacterium]
MNIASIFKSNSTPKTPAKVDRGSKEFERIDADYGTILDGYQQVSGKLATIDEETQLKPPSLSNVKDSQLLVMGATAGAAVGGSIGLASNLLTSWAAQPSIDVTTTNHDVIRPVLTGSTESRTEVSKPVTKYDQNGNPYQGSQLTGWDVKHQPTFRNENAGSYQTQEAHVNNGGIGSPITDALGGMAIGAGIGTLLAGGVVVTRKLTGKGEYVPGEARKTEGDLKVMAKMGAMGAAGGAIVGGLSGMLASGNSVTKTITNQTPVFEDKVVGQIPGDYNQSVYQSTVTNPGTQDVHRQVPVMEGGILGHGQHVKVTEQKETLTAGGGLNLVSGVLGGAVAGAGIGVAAGVLTNVLRKTL